MPKYNPFPYTSLLPRIDVFQTSYFKNPIDNFRSLPLTYSRHSLTFADLASVSWN